MNRSRPSGRAFYCRSCARDQNARSRTKRLADGRCEKCGEPVDPDSRRQRTCSRCAAVGAERMQRVRAARQVAGRCTDCDGDAPLVAWARCEECLCRQIASNVFGTRRDGWKVSALWERSGGRCALTGRAIALGSGAHIDHRIPRSRGGTDDLDNLRFVCAEANFAKRDMLDDQLVRLCREIVAHTECANDCEPVHAARDVA